MDEQDVIVSAPEQPTPTARVVAPSARGRLPYAPVPETADGLLRMPVCIRVVRPPARSRGIDTASEGRTR